MNYINGTRTLIIYYIGLSYIQRKHTIYSQTTISGVEVGTGTVVGTVGKNTTATGSSHRSILPPDPPQTTLDMID